ESFEPQSIVALHDEALAAAGTSWEDCSKFPESWYRSPEYEKYKHLLSSAFAEHFRDSKLPILNDPRLCRVLPLWRDIFKQTDRDAFYVIPFRQPSAVV